LNFGTRNVFSERRAVDRQLRAVYQIAQFHQQRAQAARVKEVFHQVLTRRPQIADHRRDTRQFVEARGRQVDAGATRHGHQMHNRIGRPRHREHGGDGVIE
jgi:hypothetical protein